MSDVPHVTVEPSAEFPESAAQPPPPRRRALARSMAPGYVLLALFFAAAAASYWFVTRPDYRFRQAWRALDNTDYDQVLHEASRLSATPGYGPHARLLEAAVEVRTQSTGEGDASAATNQQALLRKLSQAIEHEDTEPLALLILGEVMLRSNAVHDARQVLVRAMNLDPGLAQAAILNAQIAFDAGALQDAMSSLTRAARLQPLNPRPYRMMGFIAFESGNYEQAIKDYTESLRRSLHSPDRDEILLELAECEMMVDRFDDSLRTLASVKRESSRKAYLRARCHFGKGSLDEARADVRRALEIEPGNVHALLLKGTIALKAKDFEAARSALTQAVDAVPFNLEAHTKLGQVYSQLGKRALAEREIGEASRILQANTVIQSTLERAAQEPNNPEMRYQAGVRLREIGRVDEAVRCFRMALAIDPAHTASQEALQELFGDANAEAAIPAP